MATQAKRVLVPLAEGFEEIEFAAIVDVLRRGGVEVVVAGLAGRGPVRGAHGIEMTADADLATVKPAGFDMVVLPGGTGGTERLAADARVLNAVKELHAAGKSVAAICAAPTVLARAGVLSGVRVTSYPSVRGRLGDAVVVDEPEVVESGTIVTSQGPGTAIEFALALVKRLAGEHKAADVRDAMIARPLAKAR